MPYPVLVIILQSQVQEPHFRILPLPSNNQRKEINAASLRNIHARGATISQIILIEDAGQYKANKHARALIRVTEGVNNPPLYLMAHRVDNT